MAKKVNKISVSKFESLLNKEEIKVMTITEDVVVEIIHTLPLSEVIEYVEVVANSCFNEESGEFFPQILDFAIKKELLTRYANFTMPQSTEKQYKLIYGTDVVNIILPHINRSQFEEIREGINRKIKFIADSINNAATAATISLAGKIEAFAEQSEEVFGDLSKSDIADALKQISAMSAIDDGKIVQAIKAVQIEE